MLKEQIRTEIARIFDNPEAWHVVKNTYGDITIDEPILKVEWVAEQILALFPQGEGGVLCDDDICSYCEEYPCELWEEEDGYSTCSKFQDYMERVIERIDKSYLYLKSVCLAAGDDGELAKGYDLAMNEALSELVALKAELEGENE